MKKVVFILLAVAFLCSYNINSQDGYNAYNVDKTKIERPGSQGYHMGAVDKDKIRRPGSQVQG